MSSLAIPATLPVGDIRTLQWDTDPSVLQLQADSELGYIFLLSLYSLTKKRKKTQQNTLLSNAWRIQKIDLNLVINLKDRMMCE